MCQQFVDFQLNFIQNTPTEREVDQILNLKVNPLNTKRICFIQGLSPYRAVNTPLRL
jgi:hypothetical protein